MNLAQFTILRNSCRSLAMSTTLSIASGSVRCDVTGLNSPYSSHCRIQYSYIRRELPAVVAGAYYNHKSLLVVLQRPPLDLEELEPVEQFLREELLFPASPYVLRLDYDEVPWCFLEPMWRRGNDFLPVPNVSWDGLVWVSYPVRNLLGFAEDGSPIFERVEQEDVPTLSSTDEEEEQ